MIKLIKFCETVAVLGKQDNIDLYLFAHLRIQNSFLCDLVTESDADLPSIFLAT